MLVVVPFRRTPAAAKGWLLLVFFLPWVGLVLYLLIGRPRFPRWRQEQFGRLPQVLGGILERLRHHPNVFRPDLPPSLSQAAALDANLGYMPTLGGNAAELLTDYDGIIDRLVADIGASPCGSLVGDEVRRHALTRS